MDQDDDASVKDQDDDAPVKDQDDDGENEEGKKETSVSTQKNVSDEATTSKKPVSLSPNVSAITEPRQDEDDSYQEYNIYVSHPISTTTADFFIDYVIGFLTVLGLILAGMCFVL